MKAVLLDGSRANDETGARVRAALRAELEAQGWDVEHVSLCDQTIGACGGEFYCWIKHPGTCMLNDDNRAIAAAIANSDLSVYLTPVTFGGYSSTLKRMVDHQIQNISPFFAEVDGETHHRKRYKRPADVLAIGWMDAPDAPSEAVFRHLAWRIGLNWRAETVVSDVVLAGESDQELQAAARTWVTDVRSGRSSPRAALPEGRAPAAGEPVDVRRALLLVGSPKARKSTSNSLGGYLFAQLRARSAETGRSLECTTIYVQPAMRSPEKTQALLEAVDAADLVALAFPLYVDSLPAPVVEALERITAHRQERGISSRPLFVALANCGFPEAHHNAAALAICELFGRQAGFEWAGGLALGAGGMVAGVPLAEGGGKTLMMRQALDLAADALARGQAVPVEAQETLAKPVIPAWAYRRMGDLGWIVGARQHRAVTQLGRRPYAAKARPTVRS
jgi:multimeric flavodoxin WrbA